MFNPGDILIEDRGFLDRDLINYLKSKLKLDDNKIVYDRQVEYEWTAVGHLNTKNIYEISKFDDYKFTSRWIILYGNFEYTEIYKGKKQ